MQSKVDYKPVLGASSLGPTPEQLVNIGVKSAALLREIREFADPTLNYFFEMAWFSLYQRCDERTRVKLIEAVEADLLREQDADAT